MLKLLLDNKDGNVWDISHLVTGVTWKTTRIGKPGSLDFTLIKGSLWQDPQFRYNNGDIVVCKYNGANVFYGYIFSIDGGKEEAVRIKCYDQIRYLNNVQTYVFENKTASEIVRAIAKDFELQVGFIQDTKYKIPTMVEDGQKLIDIIDKALALTLIHTGQNFVLYDDFGLLTVRNIEDMLIGFYLGDNSLMHNYELKKTIDSDTYNRVKLYRDNESTGRREVYLAQDSANIARWGLLQLYEQAADELNPAQISEKLDMYMALKNRENRQLKLDCIGDARVRAGCYVQVVIQEYNINQPFLIDECTHRWEDGDYQMSLDLKVV